MEENGSSNLGFRDHDRIQMLIAVAQEHSRAFEQDLQIIRESRAEIQDLIILQKEQRIDIMALFAANKDLRDQFQQYFEKHSS